ncbi:corrinoid protein [Candidatus Contubernalis alkalaceticus]|nr:corrinoid protein [Candidatus Contubernalis alkalaceticus]
MAYELISETVIDGDVEKLIKLIEGALRDGCSADDIFEYGLVNGMNRIAEKFRYERVMIPEVLVSARAMHAGLMTIDPYIEKTGQLNSYKVVIGTVAGDLHDIGKSLIIMLLSAMGIQITDLGVDVSVKKFIQAVKKEQPHYLMLSSLLTTTMPAMQEVIEELDKRGLRSNMKVVIGGGPIRQVFADEIGADLYFEDAFQVREYLAKKFKNNK